MTRALPWLLAIVLVACAHPGAPVAASAPAPHRYLVPEDVERLLVDGAAFATFARPLRRDLEADLTRGAPLDRATRRDRLFDLALLDALDGDWDGAVARLDRIAAEEPDATARIMTGLTIRVWADAHHAGGGTRAAFAAALEQRVTAMPYDAVREPFAALREMGRVFSAAYCQQLIQEYAGAAAARGALSLEQASAVLFQRYVVVELVPVGPVITEVMGRVMAAHGD